MNFVHRVVWLILCISESYIDQEELIYLSLNFYATFSIKSENEECEVFAYSFAHSFAYSFAYSRIFNRVTLRDNSIVLPYEYANKSMLTIYEADLHCQYKHNTYL